MENGGRIDIERVFEFLDKYGGKKYSSGMNDIYEAGHSSRDIVTALANIVKSRFDDFISEPVNNWKTTWHYCTNYFWIELKKSERKDLNISISIHIFKDKISVSTELNESRAGAGGYEYKALNKTAEMEVTDSCLFYNVCLSDGRYYNYGHEHEEVKELYNKNEIKKLQIQSIIPKPYNNDRIDVIIDEITERIKLLMPYYEKAISELKQTAQSSNCWIYTAGTDGYKWEEHYKQGIMALDYSPKLGDFKQYKSREELLSAMKEVMDPNDATDQRAGIIWNFTHDMSLGDIVYVRKGTKQIVGKGIVESDVYYDESKENFRNIRNVKWLHKIGKRIEETFGRGTLYRYNHDPNTLEKYFKDEPDTKSDGKDLPVTYTKPDFLKELFLSEADRDKLCALLEHKKNVILQGAPGVGKTFAAKRLAYMLMGEKDSGRVCCVQFHQSYSYEDFIMGIRPDEDGGFKLKNGVFYDFCEKAKEDGERKYFFIIDEINRGNLSKIFGELLMLIETDKRGAENSVKLVYSGEDFYVPENLYIIGMMNTADRSLAMIDYALRRRFAFFTMKPAFDSEGFDRQCKRISSPLLDRTVDAVRRLNGTIEEDHSLGGGFCIGHSYFCFNENDAVTDERIRNVIEYEIIPLIEEYWFDNRDKFEEEKRKLETAAGIAAGDGIGNI